MGARELGVDRTLSGICNGWRRKESAMDSKVKHGFPFLRRSADEPISTAPAVEPAMMERRALGCGRRSQQISYQCLQVIVYLRSGVNIISRHRDMFVQAAEVLQHASGFPVILSPHRSDLGTKHGVAEEASYKLHIRLIFIYFFRIRSCRFAKQTVTALRHTKNNFHTSHPYYVHTHGGERPSKSDGQNTINVCLV